MSLSCTEPSLIELHHVEVRRPVAGRSQLQELLADVKAGAVEATLSTHVASVMLRVVSCMALGFALVRLVKFYIT